MTRHSGLDPVSGWFGEATTLVSPNFDLRPAGVDVDLIVIHAISLPPGSFGGGYVEQFFRNRLDESAHPYFRDISSMKVSSHLYIDRRGHLTQFVSTHMRAWHCGLSNHAGRGACNDFSVGIELEGCDERAFSEAQYLRIGPVLSELMNVHRAIGPDAIVGHSDIAPDRKTDPGPNFDWARVRAALAE